MKPINVCMRLVGIDRIILGSTGHGGRQAAEQLVRELRDGRSTGIAPASRFLSKKAASRTQSARLPTLFDLYTRQQAWASIGAPFV
jgi:hypothetical protein